jgi:hypothetical protein
MDKKIVVLAFVVLSIVIAFFAPQPVAAWAGVNLIVRDSLTLQPWLYGGDVYLLNQTTGTTVATGRLDSNGQVVLTHGTCDSAVPDTCVVPAFGNVIEIVIDFQCQASGASLGLSPCGGPNGPPNTFGELTYTQNGLINVRITRNVETGTGPLAVNLSNIGGASGSVLPYAAVGLVMVLGVATMFVVRRRQA